LREGANGLPSARSCLGVGHDGGGGWGEGEVVRRERGDGVASCGDTERCA